VQQPAHKISRRSNSRHKHQLHSKISLLRRAATSGNASGA
jgi:hypothetical protein